MWYQVITKHKGKSEGLFGADAEQSFFASKFGPDSLVNAFLIITQSHYLNETFPLSLPI